MLLLSLGVYFVDANLNFPIARPQVLVVWSCVMGLIMGYDQKFRNKKYKQSNNKVNKAFLIFGILIVVPTVYVTNQVYMVSSG